LLLGAEKIGIAAASESSNVWVRERRRGYFGTTALVAAEEKWPWVRQSVFSFWLGKRRRGG
jgi:hypothetical protein